ncbi:hypothetical protein ACFL53_04655 [Pseudomonadota bacterium]
MIRQLLKLDTFNFRSCSLSYALWSDGVIEKVVTKKNQVVSYKEIQIIDDAISCEELMVKLD